MKTLHGLSLTDDEIETLYDALDAQVDRLENWDKQLKGENPRDEVALKRIEEDLAAANQLMDEFQPLIEEIRRERERAAKAARRSSSQGREEPGSPGPGRGPSRIRSVPAFLRRRDIPGPKR